MEPAVPLAWPPAAGDLPRTFADRHELAVELQARFGQQPAAPDAEDAPPLSPMRGGRAAALAALAALDPVAYATSRNHLDGAVTRLSPTSATGCSPWRRCGRRCSRPWPPGGWAAAPGEADQRARLA